MDRWHALADACHKRARPIIMTTMAMGGGHAARHHRFGLQRHHLRFPDGDDVLGGLITSTALSLLVVPAVFTYVDDFGQWMHRLWHRAATRHGHTH